MAKNLNSTAYRKIDVDALDDDKFEDGGEENGTNEGVDERTVNGLLQSGRNVEALHCVLSNAPMGSKVEQNMKDKATAIVARVLQSFKGGEVEKAVGELNDTEADTLIKFVYRAFEILAEGALCQSLLQWHAQICAKFGKGPIVRTLSSRTRL